MMPYTFIRGGFACDGEERRKLDIIFVDNGIFHLSFELLTKFCEKEAEICRHPRLIMDSSSIRPICP